MRVLRLTMLGLTMLMVFLAALMWYRGTFVVDFAVANGNSVHFLGHRTYFLQVLYHDSAAVLSRGWRWRMGVGAQTVPGACVPRF